MMESSTYATRVPVADQPKCLAMPAQTPPIMAFVLDRLIRPLSLIVSPRVEKNHTRIPERKVSGLQIAQQRSYISIISKSSLAAPQSGHTQNSGTSSQRVPGARPSSGHPFSSS
jgi:hypothetical protein